MVAQKVNRRLTHKEEAFAQHVAKGETHSDAYKKAYNSTTPNAKVVAHRIVHKAHVAARIAELRAPDETRKFLTRARKREILWQIAEDARATRLERQRSIMIDNRMTGDDRTVVNIEGEITLVSVMAALNGSGPLPSVDEAIDIPSFPQLPAGPKATADAPSTVGQAVSDNELSEGVPGGETATPPGPPRPRGPFDEDFDLFTTPPAPTPQKRRSRVYPA